MLAVEREDAETEQNPALSSLIATALALPTGQDWENHINPALHAMWSKSDAEMRDMMRRGPNGTGCYCAALEYFITEREAQSAIMEARVERLCVAIEHLWV